MNKTAGSGAVWPVIRRVLGTFAIVLVSMAVAVYAMAAFKQSTGWGVTPMQEVKNLFSLLWGFAFIIGAALVVLAIVVGLVVFGVKSVRKGGTGPLILGLVGLFAAAAIAWFGGTYVLDLVKIDSYQATWFLPAFFAVVGVGAVLAGYKRPVGSKSGGRKTVPRSGGSNAETGSVPVVMGG